MKQQVLKLTTVGLACLLAGCVNPDGSPNNTGSGALVGGAVGALAGAAIGGSRHGGPDALIGAAAGALTGALIGNSADREQEAHWRAVAPPPPPPPPAPTGLADVKAMARAGVSDDVIIEQMRTTRTIYHLAASDIISLRDAGVSDKVLNFMLSTPTYWATH